MFGDGKQTRSFQFVSDLIEGEMGPVGGLSVCLGLCVEPLGLMCRVPS